MAVTLRRETQHRNCLFLVTPVFYLEFWLFCYFSFGCLVFKLSKLVYFGILLKYQLNFFGDPLEMNIIVLPPILALIVNFAVLWAASRSNNKTAGFIPLVIGFSMLNICEILGSFSGWSPAALEFIVRCYYCCAVVSLTLVTLYAAEISKYQTLKLNWFVGVLTALVTLAIMFSDLILVGIHSIGYSVSANKGIAYIVFQLFSLALLISVGVMLTQGYRKAQTHEQQIKCSGTAVAIMPSLIACLGLLVLMWFGIKINAIIVLPLTIMAFILITLALEERHKLTDIRRFIPGSAERRASREVMEICSNYARDEVSYRDAISEIERVLVLHKYQKNHKNASATAELMGMPRSSLYSIFNRLKIESKNN